MFWVKKFKTWMKDKTPDKRIVYIKSGIDVDYGRVVEAIDTIRKQDIDKIGLVADKKKGGEAGTGERHNKLENLQIKIQVGE